MVSNRTCQPGFISTTEDSAKPDHHLIFLLDPGRFGSYGQKWNEASEPVPNITVRILCP